MCSFIWMVFLCENRTEPSWKVDLTVVTAGILLPRHLWATSSVALTLEESLSGKSRTVHFEIPLIHILYCRFADFFFFQLKILFDVFQ